MHRRVLIALALVVVTAGCGAFAGDRTTTPTLTPAPVPTQPSPPPGSGVLVAPGLSTTNVTDVSRLAESHLAAANETSYVWRERATQTRGDGDETVLGAESHTTVVRNGSRYTRTTTFTGPHPSRSGPHRYRIEAYGTGIDSYRFWQFLPDGEPEYRSETSPSDGEQGAESAARAIHQYLDLDSATVQRTAVGEGDHFLVIGTTDALAEYGPVEDYRARALVREDGFVRNLDVRFDLTANDVRWHVEYHFDYREVGTATVTEPPWLDEAKTALSDDDGDASG